MASNKNIIQNFSNFKGKDSRSSDLTRPLDAAKEAQNFIIEQNFSLGGEKGLHMFADYFEAEPIVGIHTYVYKDEETGREVQELLVLGKHLYRLKEGTFTINYSGSNTWGYDFFLDTADSELRFRLIDNGSTVLDYNVGTGLEDDVTGTTKLSALEAQIDAITNFTADSNATVDAIVAACFPLTASYSIPSSTTSVDITVYYWEQVYGRKESYVPPGAPEPTEGVFSPYVNAHDDVNIKPPVFENKNNCCYIVCDGYMPLMKYDGAEVVQAGVIGIPDAAVTITGAANSPALVGSYRYYIRFVRKDSRGNYIYGSGHKSEVVTTTSGQAPRISLYTDSASPNNSVAPFALALPGSTDSGSSNSITLGDSLSKYDPLLEEDYGHTPVKVGDFIYIVVSASVHVRRRITALDRSVPTITFDGPAVPFDGSEDCYWNNLAHFGWGDAVVNGNQSGVSEIALTSVDNIIVGQYVRIEGVDGWFKVTAVDELTPSITIDDLVDVSNGDVISSLAVEIFRTENNGVEQFFYSQTIPAGLTTSAFFDSTADAALGYQLDVPLPEYEPDYQREFPSILTQHQGLLLTAGGSQRAGRISFESFEFLEGFPLATNFYDVPSNDAGIITALWSDTYDQLAVFKDTAYYSVTGSFRDAVPILNADVNSENDLGVACQSAIVKVRGRLNLGLGKAGFIAFANGRIDYEFTKQLDADFLSANVGNVLDAETKLRFHKTQAINDTFKRQALFFVPAFDLDATGLVTQGANQSSKLYMVDYSENTWTERVFTDVSGESGITNYPFYPTAGMTQYNDRLILASAAYDSTVGNGDHTDYNSYIFRRKEREVYPSGITDTRYDYSDMHSPIPYRYDTGWMFLEPLEDGLFHWLKVYSFPTTDFVPFDLRIRSYIDWDTSTAIDDTTISFTATSYQHLFKLAAIRLGSIQLRFDTNAVLEKPTIHGFEIVVGDVDGNLEGVR